MTPNILYSKSKFHLIRDYPEKPEYCFTFSSKYPCDGNNIPSAGYCVCYEAMEAYDQAVAKSLASAIEFDKKEDQERIKWLLWNNDDIVKPSEYADFDKWEPEEGQLFTVNGIGVEVENQERRKAEEGIPAGQWYPIHRENWDHTFNNRESRQVVRLKTKSDGQTNVEEYHDATGKITREEFNTGLKPKDLKAKPERKGEDMQRWFTCETCNGLGRITQQQYNSIYPKDSALPEPKGENGARRALRRANEREQIVQILERHYGKGNAINSAVHELQDIADKLNQSAL